MADLDVGGPGRGTQHDGAVDDVVTGDLGRTGLYRRSQDLLAEAVPGDREPVVERPAGDAQVPDADADDADLDRAGGVDPRPEQHAGHRLVEVVVEADQRRGAGTVALLDGRAGLRE